MPLLQITWNPTSNQLRLFALAQVPFFVFVSVIVVRLSGDPRAAAILMGCSGATAIIGMCFPRVVRCLYVAWMAALFPVAWTVSHILLAVIYYWLLAPIGLIMKLAGRDPLRRKFDRSAATYWNCRKPKKADDYFKQY